MKKGLGLYLETMKTNGIRPVVTGYLFFRPLFAETSYVSFVPAHDHLDIAKIFHD
jgi:hypothetical protein